MTDNTWPTTHHWVKHVITPVEVLADGVGDPVVLVDPDQQIISEDDAAYGCDQCGCPMAGNLKTPCPAPGYEGE